MSEDNHRINALALNAISQGLADVEGHVPLSEREQLAADVVAAVRPALRAQAAEEIFDLFAAAPDGPSGLIRLGAWMGRAQVAWVQAEAQAERRQGTTP